MAAIPHLAEAILMCFFFKWAIMDNYSLYIFIYGIYLHNINLSDPIPVVPQADVQPKRAAGEMEWCVFAPRAAQDTALPRQLRVRHRLDVFFRPGLQHSGRGETPLSTVSFHPWTFQWSTGDLKVPKQHTFCSSQHFHGGDEVRSPLEWLDKSKDIVF